MKSKNRDYKKNCGNFSSLPEKVFNGNFVVFTVVALLELPNGVKYDDKLISYQFTEISFLVIKFSD